MADKHNRFTPKHCYMLSSSWFSYHFYAERCNKFDEEPLTSEYKNPVMKRFLLILSSTLLVLGCQKEVYHDITVSVNPADGGSVSLPSGPVLDGTSVSFKATPKGDYVFSGWSGDISGTENPKTCSITQDMNVIANFTLKSYPLTITVDGEGTVSEKVISVKSDYSSGTVVELTATPAQGWSFDHWEGDTAGIDNPLQITLVSNMSIKAIFKINSFSYALKIIGPGVVNESIVQTKSYDYGTTMRLTAIPNIYNDAFFMGWEGDVSGSEEDITVNINKDTEIIARFAKKPTPPARQYPLLSLNQPSYNLGGLYINEDFSEFTYSAYQMLFVDYNRDGYLDVITTTYSGDGGLVDADRLPIRFYLRNPDGTYSPDPKNDNRMMGLLHSRKPIYGDYNCDGMPDICLIGHGYDSEPWPGEYPIILMSNPNGEYNDVRFTNMVAFYHGGSSGDFDNDGDLDIALIDANTDKSGILVNDGKGNFNFHRELLDKDSYEGFLINSEMYDIDKDGYLDMVLGGSDMDGKYFWETEERSYEKSPIIIWGNGQYFKVSESEYSVLPECPVKGFGIVTHFLFYDLDNDGTEELVVSRTGDGIYDIQSYSGWSVQVLRRSCHSYEDVTSLFLDLNDSYCIYDNLRNAEWLVRIDICESDEGQKYLCGVFDSPKHPSLEKLFRLENNKFIRLQPEIDPTAKQIDGVCVYHDKIEGDDFCSTLGIQNRINMNCTDSPYSGSACISWKADEAWKQSISYQFPNFLDFSELVKGGYEIEFYVKYTSSCLRLCTNLESEYKDLNSNMAFGYSYYLPSEYADGDWHRIHVPLSDFYLCENTDNEGWKRLKIFKMWVTSENTVGEEFYIDEIRIRKPLN